MFNAREIAQRDYSKEFAFQTSRSSGPGGQHVNKVETRVTLKFHVGHSQILTDKEKQRLSVKWEKKLTSEGLILIHAERFRSQQRNKEAAIQEFRSLLEKAFTDPRPRKKTKPSKASIQKRLDTKKKHSGKKESRKKPDY